MEGMRIFRAAAMAAVLVVVSGCLPRVPTFATNADDSEGTLVAGHLTVRYSETSIDCGGPRSPIFLCSGIMIRGTQYSPAYHSWVPNPGSPKGDGVSFSFLRKDAAFNKLAYSDTHGFIVYPMVYNPGPVIDLEILCGFPIDADTDNRVDRGCGYNRSYSLQSGPCQAQGISSSAQWLAHYRTAGIVDPRRHECGFTLTSGTADSEAVFMQMIAAMQTLGAESLNTQNELIVKSWKNTPNKVGIEAFFYLAGSGGEADSRNEQQDFYNTTNVWRPIIRVTLPTAKNGTAAFAYLPADQAVRAGGAVIP